MSETGQTEKFVLRGGRLRWAKLRFLISRAASKAIREPLRKIRAPIRHFLLNFVKGFPVELEFDGARAGRALCGPPAVAGNAMRGL